MPCPTIGLFPGAGRRAGNADDTLPLASPSARTPHKVEDVRRPLEIDVPPHRVRCVFDNTGPGRQPMCQKVENLPTLRTQMPRQKKGEERKRGGQRPGQWRGAVVSARRTWWRARLGRRTCDGGLPAHPDGATCRSSPTSSS